MLATSTCTPPRQGDQRAGRVVGCVCATNGNLEGRAQSVLLGWAGCSASLAGKGLHENVVGWFLTGW